MTLTPAADEIRILHVDDDPAFGDLLATFLSRHDDFVVRCESSTEAALSHLGAVDCVVSDYDMPDTNGLEFLGTVRDREPELPFILLTGKGSEEIASEAVAAGVDGYLQKGGGSDRYELLANRIRSVVSEARATRQAQEATKRLQEVYQRTTDGVVALDREWHYTYLNARAGEVLGVDPDELVGTELWTAFPGLVGTPLETHLRTAMEMGEPISFDSYFEPLETHFAIRAFPGEEGLSVYFSDVTDEQRMRQQLVTERRVLDAAVDALDDIFYVLDANGEGLVRWNNELEAVTGRSSDELAALAVTELFVPSDRPLVRATLDAVLDGRELTGEARFDTDPEPRRYEFHTVPLYDEDETLVGACGIGRDVTTQRSREAHLERVETIVEALGDPVYTTDDAGRLTYVNDAFTEFTGYDTETALGADAAELLKTEAGREKAFEAIRRAYRHDTPERFEFELQTASGESVPCEDHLSLLPTDDEFRGTAGVIRDISQRNEREATLRRQRDQLDEFAAVASHDLQNPLSVAIGHVQLARETESVERLDVAEDALERMDRLVRELLRLARAGAVVDDFQPVALEGVVRDAWSVTETGEATLTVGDLPTVSGDASRLTALFENLFRNAVEHGSTSPHSHAREDAVERGSTSSRSHAHENSVEHGSTSSRSETGDQSTDADPPLSVDGGVAGTGREPTADRTTDPLEVRVGPLTTDEGVFVEDTGEGFDADADTSTDIDDLFDPGVSMQSDGTGYGLAIVHDIAEAHGWAVDARSGDDGGARFEFRFSS